MKENDYVLYVFINYIFPRTWFNIITALASSIIKPNTSPAMVSSNPLASKMKVRIKERT